MGKSAIHLHFGFIAFLLLFRPKKLPLSKKAYRNNRHQNAYAYAWVVSILYAGMW